MAMQTEIVRYDSFHSSDDGIRTVPKTTKLFEEYEVLHRSPIQTVVDCNTKPKSYGTSCKYITDKCQMCIFAGTGLGLGRGPLQASLQTVKQPMLKGSVSSVQEAVVTPTVLEIHEDLGWFQQKSMRRA